MRFFSRKYRAVLEPQAFHQGGEQRNWRLPAFCIVFLVAAAGGLIYTYARPAEYRAIAKLAIMPAERLPGDANEPAAANKAPDAFLTELEFLSSRPALQDVYRRLRANGLAALLDGDGVEALQRMISTHPGSGTQIVELWAVGPRPEVLAPALNQLMTSYAELRAEEFINTSAEGIAQVKDELAKYDKAVTQKRRELDQFRTRYGIVSQERDENAILARARGLGTALNTAQERSVNAQARLRAIRAAIASGKAPVRTKDNQNIAALEQRLAQAREELGEYERRYTAQYLKREPQAVKLQKLIPALEADIARERDSSLQSNIAEAEQEAAQAQEALDRLKAQYAAEQGSMQAFTSHFGEYKGLQEELTQLEAMQRRTSERLVRIEAREGARKPQFKIIEAAAMPQTPWRPAYTRDAGIALGVALGLGLLAAWLAEYLLAPRQSPLNIVVAPTSLSYPSAQPTLIGASVESTPTLLDAAPTRAHLPAPATVGRELTDTELRSLLEAAEDDAGLALIMLLSGVSAEELIEMRWAQFDAQSKSLRIADRAAREISLTEEICAVLSSVCARRSAKPDDRLFAPGTATGKEIEHLQAVIAYAAHDAGLENPAEITPALIRHTYIAYLARQGMRFSDLARIVGPLPAEAIAMYGALSPNGSRRALDAEERVMPALRSPATS